jgi:hypothetical protein
MFRLLIVIAAVWPLLMPPGMCLCQLTRGADVTSGCTEQSCVHDDDDECCCPSEGDRVQYPCAPTEEQHSPCCPASKKMDDSKMLQRYQSPGSAALTAAPLPFFVAPSSGQRLNGPSSPVPPDQPVYLTLCMLLI